MRWRTVALDCAPRRSAAFILAYIMRAEACSVLAATKLVKRNWAATWPCDRFVQQLLEYERELVVRRAAKPEIELSTVGAVALSIVSAATGALFLTLLKR